MKSKIPLCLFSVFLMVNVGSVFADEVDPPIITIDFVSGNIIDLDEGTQMVRADIQIQNYNPQDGYHFMQVIRLSDGEIIKDTEIMPKYIEDDLYGVQILHYLNPDESDDLLLGDYGLRVYSEYGTSESVSTFSIIKSSSPVTLTQNHMEESEIEPLVEESKIEPLVEESKIEPLVEESKIPTWVHDIFIWYADEIISESELLTALEYLISEGILNVPSN